jgi:hypothetical protein
MAVIKYSVRATLHAIDLDKRGDLEQMADVFALLT